MVDQPQLIPPSLPVQQPVSARSLGAGQASARSAASMPQSARSFATSDGTAPSEMLSKKKVKYPPPCCGKESMADVSEFNAYVILIINICIPGVGTMLSACLDKKGCNYKALLIGFIQMITPPFGLCWAIAHSRAIIKNAKYVDDEDDWQINPGLSSLHMADLLDDLATVEEYPSFTTIDGIKFDIERDFKVDMIKSQFLKDIFLGNSKEAIKQLHKVRLKKDWSKDFEHDLIIAFWLAVHTENVYLSSYIMNWELSLREIVLLAMKGKGEMPKDFKVKNKRKKLLGMGQSNMNELKELRKKHSIPKIPSLASLHPVNLSQGSRATASRTNLHKERGPLQRPNIQYEGGEDNSLQTERLSLNDMQQFSRESSLGESPDFPPTFRKIQKDREVDFQNSSSNSSQSNLSESSSFEYWDKRKQKYVEHELQDDDSCESNEDEEDDDDDDDDQVHFFDEQQGTFVKTQSQIPTAVEGQIEFEDRKNVAQPPNVVLQNPKQEFWLDKKQITGFDIEIAEFSTKAQIKKLKVGLQLRFPLFCIDVIKILLYREEIDLACYMTAFYNLWIEKEQICAAVEYRWLKWMKYVFAFKKNILSNERGPDGEPKNVSFTVLFNIINKYYTQDCFKVNENLRNANNEQLVKEIEYVCQWKLKLDDNILKALLFHKKDKIALDYIGIYSHFLDEPHGAKLFLFSIENKND